MKTRGQTLDIKLADLVEPWIGSTVRVQFPDGQIVAAKIVSVDEEQQVASIVVTDDELKKLG